MSEEYKEKCRSIITLLRNYRPDVLFEVVDSGGNMEVFFPDYFSMFTITQTSNWKQLQRIIDSKLIINENESCQICLNNFVTLKINCSSCGERWCIKCYINIYAMGQGVVKCPYCRYSVGDKLNENDFRLGLLDLNDRFTNTLG